MSAVITAKNLSLTSEINDGPVHALKDVEMMINTGEFVKRDPNGAVNRALSSWKELTAPNPVNRTGIPASGV